MKILGISGLPGLQESISNELESNVDNYMSRVCQGLDSAAAIVIDGRIVCAIAEERLSGNKGTGSFPRMAIEECMRIAGIRSIEEFDSILHGFDYRGRPPSKFKYLYSPQNLIDNFQKAFKVDVEKKFIAVAHHVAHAYSAVHTSNFDSCLCIVADGMGETEALSVYSYKNMHLEKIFSYPISSSIAIIYSIFTRYLGFEFNMDEYKVMGMSAYGQDSYSEIFNSILSYKNGKLLARIRGGPSNDSEYWGKVEYLEGLFSIPRGKKSEDLTQSHFDIACSLQKASEKTIVALASDWLKKTGHTKLCLAGGLFLNCLINEKISELVEDLFVQPASGDDGTALGSALYGAINKGENIHKDIFFNPYLGPSYDDEVDRVRLLASEKGLAVSEPLELINHAVESIAKGEVITWFNGRMEFGPRALGARSILANPCSPAIKEKINSSIKFRELFRPFAPAILMEDAMELFDLKLTSASYYMLQTANAKEKARNLIPGVIHADGSARIQVLDENLNKVFYELVSKLKERIGVGCVLNTSFNLKGQPLICSPEIAIDTFLKTNIDKLYICGLVLQRRGF